MTTSDTTNTTAASTFADMFHQVVNETVHGVSTAMHTLMVFVLPKWSTDDTHSNMNVNSNDDQQQHSMLHQLWQHAAHNYPNVSIADKMFLHFDTNKDGTISYAELLHIVTEQAAYAANFRPHPETWGTWFTREWPLMDWKVGLFLWRTFGGMLVVLFVASIIPGRLHGISARVLRWPILGLTYFLVIVELAVYVVIRLGIRVAEYLVARPKHRKMRREMAQAESYQEWYALGAELDHSQQRDNWLKRVDDHTSYRYNWAFIRELIKDMRIARANGDALLALAVIQQCTRKNVGGIMSEDLFSYSNTGEPKVIVREFIEEVVTTLHWITDDALQAPVENRSDDYNKMQQYDETFQNKIRTEQNKIRSIMPSFGLLNVNKEQNFDGGEGSTRSGKGYKRKDSNGPRTLPSSHHRERVVSFLKRARAAYGRTALCLSGGSMMGCYHFGHVFGMLETGTLPHIISGTSAGSVVAAILCTRTDEELKRDFTPDVLDHKLTCFARSWTERLKSVVDNGNMFSFEEWYDLIKWFTCGDMTFEEAYEKTGRVFCITLSSTTKKAPPVLLNYITAPNVVVASAVVASAAVPGFIPAVRLMYKDVSGIVRQQGGEETYVDGSIRQDIPVNGLAEMLNCQFFITCQCNPHIVPFFFNSKGGVGRPSRWSSGTQEDSWRGGFLLAALEMYLKNDMKAKNVFLDGLEAAVGFTSTLLTQDFVGSTTVVPQVSLVDYFKLLSDPTKDDLYRYFQAGAIASYEHTSMVKLHYSIADALEECLTKLDARANANRGPPKRPQFTVPGTKKQQ